MTKQLPTPEQNQAQNQASVPQRPQIEKDPFQTHEEQIRYAKSRAYDLYQTYVSYQQSTYNYTRTMAFLLLGISTLAIIGSVILAFISQNQSSQPPASPTSTPQTSTPQTPASQPLPSPTPTPQPPTSQSLSSQNQSFNQIFAIVLFAGGVLIALVLISKHPFGQLKNQMREIMKIDMIYTGFSRQIDQIDSEYRKLSSRPEVSAKELKALSQQIQEAVQQAINMFALTIDEIEE